MNPLRREILRTLGGSLALLPIASAFAASRSNIDVTKLNDQLAIFNGAGANVVAFASNDGITVVDGGLAEHSTDLLKAVRNTFAARRLHTLINTHWHPEQTGSNLTLGREGAKIIAHENTRLWLGTDAPLPLLDKTYGPLPAKALPIAGLYTKDKLMIGQETIEYGYVPQAHTDGDLYVHFQNQNILVAGGILSSESWPIIDYKTGGWIGGLANGVKQLVALTDEHTRIVPANGPVMSRAELMAQQEMYQRIFEATIKLLTKGLSPDEAVAQAPTKGMMPQWGDPTVFVLQAFKSLWPHHAPDA
jgi:glyoxylase-like metal-dependent hydrolase (beta-lactamase superfamily II)